MTRAAPEAVDNTSEESLKLFIKQRLGELGGRGVGDESIRITRLAGGDWTAWIDDEGTDPCDAENAINSARRGF